MIARPVNPFSARYASAGDETITTLEGVACVVLPPAPLVFKLYLEVVLTASQQDGSLLIV